MGILAFPFGALLTVTTLGRPLSMLENSPFSSFVIPGVILCLVVGGMVVQTPFAIYALVIIAVAWRFYVRQRAQECSGE
jgi:hypothetical protein